MGEAVCEVTAEAPRVKHGKAAADLMEASDEAAAMAGRHVEEGTASTGLPRTAKTGIEETSGGKGVLGTDCAYMHDDGTRGRLFVTFLALRIRTEMAMRIQDAGPSSKRSPEDVLMKCASAYVLRSPDADLDCEVGTDVVRLDKGLGLNLYR
ncbi:MAG: hypothetical protein LBS92_00245 [Candidatus Methanoplasma sp.]|jgi:hypothetical protein|nr:hypothetical protein [Candidatus Methanoplasma sp.]